MVREQTLTTIDSNLKRQAKDRGINFSQTLEEALKLKLDPDNIIENLEHEKIELLERVDQINREIDRLKDDVLVVEGEKDEEEIRLSEALDICIQSYKRNGFLKRSILNFQADKFRVSPQMLEKFFNEAVGELSDDGQASIRFG